MRRELESRPQAVGAERAYPVTGEAWIKLADGMLRGHRDKTITAAEVDRLCARLPFVLLLPDNGRDAARP